MPYTLMKGLVWILLAVVIGIVIGWLLRSVAAKRQIERARAANPDGADHQELERLRGRVANLEPVVNERDRLRAELDRAGHADVNAPAGVAAVPPATKTGAGSLQDTDADDPDASAAAGAELGQRIELDDLTAIEGIGPKIADLCHGIGIRTWAELSTTEVSLLRTMLNDAGQRFKAHDPSTWPEQARLLAAGSWSEFKSLADEFDGGRPVD